MAQQKKQNKAQKKKEKKKEESLAPVYSKSELKRAEALRREKQRLQNLQRKGRHVFAELGIEEQKEQQAQVEPQEPPELPPMPSSPVEEPKKSSRWFCRILGLFIVFTLFIVIVRMFPTYRLVLDIPDKSLDAFQTLSDSMKTIYGTRYILSEMSYDAEQKVKRLYIQINFKSFSELCNFYLSPWFKRLAAYSMMFYSVCATNN